jgi:hypothetical protein
MTIKRVFKNTMANTQYLFKNGKAAQFPGGRYLTDDPVEIAELDAEIRGGMPHLYADPEDFQVDTGLEDAINKAKADAVSKAIKDYEQSKKDEAGGHVAPVPLTIDNKPGSLSQPFKPGASELQTAAQVDTSVVKPQDAAKQPNLAKLLEDRKVSAVHAEPPKSTGIASSDNGPRPI